MLSHNIWPARPARQARRRYSIDPFKQELREKRESIGFLVKNHSPVSLVSPVSNQNLPISSPPAAGGRQVFQHLTAMGDGLWR
jgi:hypothetical protein